MLPPDWSSPVFKKGEMSRAVNKSREIFISAPHVGCGMIWLSFLRSNQIWEWKWQQASRRPAGSSVPRRQRRRWCPANSMLLSAALWRLHWITGIINQPLEERWRGKWLARGVGVWGSFFFFFEQDGSRIEKWRCRNTEIWRRARETGRMWQKHTALV